MNHCLLSGFSTDLQQPSMSQSRACLSLLWPNAVQCTVSIRGSCWLFLPQATLDPPLHLPLTDPFRAQEAAAGKAGSAPHPPTVKPPLLLLLLVIDGALLCCCNRRRPSPFCVQPTTSNTLRTRNNPLLSFSAHVEIRCHICCQFLASRDLF